MSRKAPNPPPPDIKFRPSPPPGPPPIPSKSRISTPSTKITPIYDAQITSLYRLAHGMQPTAEINLNMLDHWLSAMKDLYRAHCIENRLPDHFLKSKEYFRIFLSRTVNRVVNDLEKRSRQNLLFKEVEA